MLDIFFLPLCNLLSVPCQEANLEHFSYRTAQLSDLGQGGSLSKMSTGKRGISGQLFLWNSLVNRSFIHQQKVPISHKVANSSLQNLIYTPPFSCKTVVVHLWSLSLWLLLALVYCILLCKLIPQSIRASLNCPNLTMLFAFSCSP